LQTFHYDHNNDYHKTHLELDLLVNEYGANSQEFDEAVILLKSSPLLKTQVKSYPILHTAERTMIEPCQWYPDFFVDVICETWPNNGFYITEKFWRAVATKTPFIIYGPRYILNNLKKIGFKTFEEFWDEGYHEDHPRDRIKGIKQVLKTISDLPRDEIVWMYRNMNHIIEHNYEIFMNFTHNDLQRLTDA
jgi:hypothetical protein